ncbi:alpha/beta fold hydrolase [Aquimarina sp. D1M17]|uniref:alpha/beta hydrolase family protein n=1 Tax=Aquimarina acroporae TaxID=2937283 RepID=UPI0020BEC04D|nr:alpha/beta fold hydrolase [Aquimarina acroporae]MCK8523512.1 alpha/beta fold hydrolase [Aquimarina acroporae]
MIEAQIHATDGYLLSANIYAANLSIDKNKVLIINSATAVDKKLYHHYAMYISQQGYMVITYDYRGIANSRPKKLRGFEASFLDWGKKDFEGVLNFVSQKFPSQKVVVFGHSIGGTIIGMTEKNKIISGVINIGAQTAYYKDWDKKQRRKIYFLWHIVLPFITAIFGYFPGKMLRMLEDIPKGVITQWHGRRLHENMRMQLESNGIKFYYHTYLNKLLTLGVEDDPIGTEIAIKRIHDAFESCDKELSIIKLVEVPTTKIGHFGFFSRKFKESLWQQTLTWFNAI